MLAFLVSVPVPEAATGPMTVATPAEDGWKRELEAICSRTDDAMEMPTGELRSLVGRCDSLKPQVEALEPSARKVFLRRLQLCRDLFVYVLESREKGKPGP